MAISRDAVHYLEPHPGEPFDRVEALHRSLLTIAGSTHLAPVRPGRILAVGAGLGPWLREIGAEFPGVLLAGVRTDTIQGRAPAWAALVRADPGAGLPFVDEAFDYVRNRTIPFAAREPGRARQIQELARVLAPGGWLEIVETEPALLPMSPMTRRLTGLIMRLFDSDRDRTVVSPQPAGLLRSCGLVDLQERRFELPLGSWGGEVGTALLSNFRAVMGAVAPSLEDRLGIPTLDTLDLVARSTVEIEQNRTVAPLWFVWGRRGG